MDQEQQLGLNLEELQKLQVAYKDLISAGWLKCLAAWRQQVDRALRGWKEPCDGHRAQGKDWMLQILERLPQILDTEIKRLQEDKDHGKSV